MKKNQRSTNSCDAEKLGTTCSGSVKVDSAQAAPHSLPALTLVRGSASVVPDWLAGWRLGARLPARRDSTRNVALAQKSLTKPDLLEMSSKPTCQDLGGQKTSKRS